MSTPHFSPTESANPTSLLSVDQKDLRRFAGHFPTGVAIVTARDSKNRLYGLTLNAVTSVSLNPPLYLACLSHTSNTLRAIEVEGAFGINFLRDDQEAIARLFATKNDRKFDAIAHWQGYRDIPLIDGAVAVAVCSVEQIFVAGDHRIVVGRLEDYAISDGAPLIFHKGQFLCDKPPRA